MPFKDPIATLLANERIIVLDGALATELETRGCDLNHALWSAKVLKENPSAIYDVHLDYFQAGAQVAITASYQASIQGLKEHFGSSDLESKHLIQQSVALAQKAREDSAISDSGTNQADLLIAGSVGPYGAYLSNGAEYRGDYDIAEEEMKKFHRGRIQILQDAGVDLLACETIPSFAEIKALVSLLQSEFSDIPAWISCTLRNSTHLSDGTPLTDVVRLLNEAKQVVALGVNCIPEQDTFEAMRELRKLTVKPLVAYPNSGEQWNAVEKTWTGERAAGLTWAQEIERWYEAGARLIGGCCRTTPNDIAIVRRLANKMTS